MRRFALPCSTATCPLNEASNGIPDTLASTVPMPTKALLALDGNILLLARAKDEMTFSLRFLPLDLGRRKTLASDSGSSYKILWHSLYTLLQIPKEAVRELLERSNRAA